MLPPLKRRIIRREIEPLFPGENGLVLSPVIFEYATDVLQKRHREDHNDKEKHPNQTIQQVERDPRMRLDLPDIALDRLKPARSGCDRRGIGPTGRDKSQICQEKRCGKEKQDIEE